MEKPKPIWTEYRVQWDFLTRLCGQTPAAPELIKPWLEARQPRVRPAGARSIDSINEEVLAVLEEPLVDDSQMSLLVFPRYQGTLVMRYSTVRAHLKDCARVLSQNFVGKIEGERAFSTRVINCVYLDPADYWLPVCRPDGTPVTAPDGQDEKPVHVMTRSGPMNFLKAFEFIAPPSRLTFKLKVLSSLSGKRDAVVEADLHYLFQYGGFHGYAGERGDGKGRYTYSLTRLDSQGGRASTADD